MAVANFFLNKLLQYDEEFMEFFEKPSTVVQVDHWEYNYFRERPEIAVEPSETEAWTLSGICAKPWPVLPRFCVLLGIPYEAI